jgi:hypothetical protein
VEAIQVSLILVAGIKIDNNPDKGRPMKRDYTNNQRGEVIFGVMMIIMCAVMLFGGMHMMHGGHRHSDDGNRRVEEKHDYRNEERHRRLNDNGEYRSARDEGTESQQ